MAHSESVGMPAGAMAPTDVVRVTELSSVLGSNTLLLTKAVFVKLPGRDGTVTAMVTVAFAPEARVEKVHVMLAPVVQLPPALCVTDCNVAPAGSRSVTCTPVAASRPLFVTVRTYVNV